MASNSNKQLFQAEPVLLANSVTVLKKQKICGGETVIDYLNPHYRPS